MEIWKSLGKFEKRVLTGSMLCLLLALFYLQYGDSLFPEGGSEKPEVGIIDESVNDIRFRSAQEMGWQKAATKQKLRVGDSIFTNGTSNAKVALKNGGHVAIAENSLVVFRQVENEKLADLVSGNFKIHVQGSAKIAMNGEIVTLQGDDADLQITLDKNKKPVFKTLKGSVEVKQKDKPALTLNAQPASVPASQTVAIPVPQPTEKLMFYTWRLHDLYDQEGSRLISKEAPKNVSRTVTLGWNPSAKPGDKTFVQFGDEPTLTSALSFEPLESSLAFSTLALGDHYWRVSLDGQHWSPIEKFTLEPRFLNKAEPSIAVEQSEIPVLGDAAVVRMNLVSPVNALGFVSETSTSENFAKESTRTFWSAVPNLQFRFSKAGVYYYRFRTVSQNQELSDWSGTQALKIFEPPLADSPRLAKSSRRAYVGEKVSMEFQPGAHARSQSIEIVDEHGKVVAASEGLKIDWVPSEPGEYHVRASSRDAYGRRSATPSTNAVNVVHRPVAVAKKAVAPREPAVAEGTTTERIAPPHVPFYLNENYRSSELAVEGSMFTLQSKEQAYQGSKSPVATQLGIRVHQWWDANGFEGSLKAGVFGLNNAKGASSAKDIELRYHRRFFPGFPFGLARALQVSLFAGYEMYRNAGGGLFADQYDLIKAGTYLHFPIFERWDTGGEFVYGFGTDASKKTEISGHLNYYLKRDISMGVGYRIHLFEAGSTKSSPGYLPYREGYTEGYSSLIYHY